MIDTPVETVRARLDQAAKLAPEDDRVWLGRANLAIRTGNQDEAARWLDACQRRRPADPAVWLARLRWAMAANRADVVEQARARVSTAALKPTELHRCSAWLARQRGDVAAERSELELLVAADPAAGPALARLIELAETQGNSNRAADLRRQKADAENSLARYRKYHNRRQPIRDAVALARLAEKLGRRFEARAFLTIAVSEEPGRGDLRRDLLRVSARFEARSIGIAALQRRGNERRHLGWFASL